MSTMNSLKRNSGILNVFAYTVRCYTDANLGADVAGRPFLRDDCTARYQIEVRASGGCEYRSREGKLIALLLCNQKKAAVADS